MAVVPTNNAIHKEYVFKYRIDTTPTGTVVEITNEKRLVVGCTEGMSINMPGFTAVTKKGVG